MNTRIRELAKCNERIENFFVTGPVQRAAIEQFAELIILECANELIKWKDEPFPYDPEFGARLIKQHFGVTQ